MENPAQPKDQTYTLNIQEYGRTAAPECAEANVEPNAESNPDSSWESPQAANYAASISAKIPGYANLYEIGARLLRAALSAQAAEAQAAETDERKPRLLIVGAGGGQELETFGRAEPDWRFVGVDPSAVMLEQARLRIRGTKIESRTLLVQGELGMFDRQGLGESPMVFEAHENSEEAYDGAACLLVLHFVRGRDAKKKLLRAIAERLKPGSPLLIASLNADFASPAYPAIMEAWRLHMQTEGVPAEDWLRFAASLGPQSDPLPAEEVECLLRECGYAKPQRYFGAFLIDGWLTFRNGGEGK